MQNRPDGGRDEQDTLPAVENPNLVGISGWLAIAAICLVGWPLYGLFRVISFLVIAICSPALAFVALLNLAMIAFEIVVAFYFFKRHALTRILFPALILTNISVSISKIAIIAVAFNVPFHVGALLRPLMYAAIWLP